MHKLKFDVERNREVLATIANHLREHDLIGVKVLYHGCGDEGFIESDLQDDLGNGYNPKLAELDDDVVTHILDIAEEIVSLNYAGYENNEGGNGKVSFDLVDDVLDICCNHNVCFIAEEPEPTLIVKVALEPSAE